MAIEKRLFGTCKCGKEIFLYTIRNHNGCSATVMNYGAILVNLFVPDRNGELRDIVLGFDRLEDYYDNGSFFGSTVGPNANRIEGASFTLKDETYRLDANDGSNNLHSHREQGYHKRYWEAVEKDNGVMFLLEDDQTMGFPGKKRIQVTYTLDDTNRLQIHYQGSSDKDTVINLTNHSYFNLEGHQSGSIEEHILELTASHFTPVAAGGIPTGEIRPVKGTPFDFRKPKRIGEEINAECEQLRLTGGYDHNWVLKPAEYEMNLSEAETELPDTPSADGNRGKVCRFARVTAPSSGIAMSIYTDLPGVQFYAGNFIEDETGKEGIVYGKRHGFCLETQYFPDSVNKPEFPSAIFGPGRSYEATTIFEFDSGIFCR